MFEFYESPDKDEKIMFVHEMTSEEGYIMAVCYYTNNDQIDLFFFTETDADRLKEDYTNVTAFTDYRRIVIDAMFIGSNEHTLKDYLK